MIPIDFDLNCSSWMCMAFAYVIGFMSGVVGFMGYVCVLDIIKKHCCTPKREHTRSAIRRASI